MSAMAIFRQLTPRSDSTPRNLLAVGDIYALIRRYRDKASVQYREFDEKRERGAASLDGGDREEREAVSFGKIRVKKIEGENGRFVKNVRSLPLNVACG